MFEKIIEIYNEKRGGNPELTKKKLAEKLVSEELVTSYQYARKMFDAVDGGQIRVNRYIVAYITELCGITLDELLTLLKEK